MRLLRKYIGRCLCKRVDVYIITLSYTWQIYALSEHLLVNSRDTCLMAMYTARFILLLSCRTFVAKLLFFFHVFHIWWIKMCVKKSWNKNVNNCHKILTSSEHDDGAENEISKHDEIVFTEQTRNDRRRLTNELIRYLHASTLSLSWKTNLIYSEMCYFTAGFWKYAKFHAKFTNRVWNIYENITDFNGPYFKVSRTNKMLHNSNTCRKTVITHSRRHTTIAAYTMLAALHNKNAHFLASGMGWTDRWTDRRMDGSQHW